MDKEWTIAEVSRMCNKTKATVINRIKKLYPGIIVPNKTTLLSKEQTDTILHSYISETNYTHHLKLKDGETYTLKDGMTIGEVLDVLGIRHSFKD